MRHLALFFLLNFIRLNLYGQGASCELIEINNLENEIDPIFEKTCIYKNLKVKSFGKPDNKGRYSWESSLFLVTNSEEKEIELSDLFGSNSEKVEVYLNEKLQEEYEGHLGDPDLSECMKTIDFHKFALHEFRLDLQEGETVNFWLEYVTTSACFNVNLGLATMSYQEFDRLAVVL